MAVKVGSVTVGHPVDSSTLRPCNPGASHLEILFQIRHDEVQRVDGHSFHSVLDMNSGSIPPYNDISPTPRQRGSEAPVSLVIKYQPCAIPLTSRVSTVVTSGTFIIGSPAT